MDSRSSSRGIGDSSLRLLWACLALCLLLSRLSPCEGRRLLVVSEENGEGKVMQFEGDLVLRVPPSPSTGNSGGSMAVVPRGFTTASGRAARLMRSVPSPGVGH
ncbi:hypothetical protein HU200_018957 [Digitaria exilis]|uniref:Uncharacterized protein n=1 Tax=Digitaria exilis TaxID=1010633 RepID=A0A835F3Q8_9POAL|nr:hypothetical protein HU200_018957 [Digitaria exilis]